MSRGGGWGGGALTGQHAVLPGHVSPWDLFVGGGAWGAWQSSGLRCTVLDGTRRTRTLRHGPPSAICKRVSTRQLELVPSSQRALECLGGARRGTETPVVQGPYVCRGGAPGVGPGSQRTIPIVRERRGHSARHRDSVNVLRVCS